MLGGKQISVSVQVFVPFGVLIPDGDVRTCLKKRFPFLRGRCKQLVVHSLYTFLSLVRLNVILKLRIPAA